MSAFHHPLARLADVVGGTISPGGGTAPVVDRIIIDSRHTGVTPNTLFVALQGPRHDGHDHLDELRERGLRMAIVQQDRMYAFPEMHLIGVPDPLAALQQLAAWHRSHFRIPVIGITGSNGKTMVKEWLFQMLHREEHIVRSPGSWNSQVGVPLSVLQLAPEHTLAIFEAGISKPGEMERLEAIIRPTIGVFTHLGTAHDEGFKGLGSDAKAIEKLKLFEHAQVWIHPSDLTGLDSLDHRLPHVRPLVWSMAGHGGTEDFMRVIDHRVVGDSTRIIVAHQGSDHGFTIPFTDDASLENALTCIAVCLHLGRTASWIDGRLAELTPVDMRMRTLQGVHGSTLIDDSYSLDLSSLTVALDSLRRTAHGRRLTVVLSDVAESELEPRRLYARVARELEERGVHQLIGVGPGITAQRALFGTGARFHPDVEHLLAHEDPARLAGSVVLVKGARSFGFERIVQRWQQQVHGTELEIDLEAMRENLNHFRGRLAPGVRTMAMVKAFGYGSGALEMARLFEHERIHYLGVAYADEGIELRTQGITMPIMVMNPEPVALETLHRFDLEPEVYDLPSLHAAIAYVHAAGSGPAVHIKLDTGMHRLGFQEADLDELLATLHGSPFKVASILSHLAASEDAQHDAFTREQMARFTRMADRIDAALGYRPLRHIANSGAIARFPEAHFDMVRLGIGLHGIGANASETAHLRTTATLRTVIAQVKDIPPGDSIGYGRHAISDQPRRIAILPIGYADGFLRRLGHGAGRVHIHGHEARTVGSICMDMCMIDVTAVPCSVGDEAIVFGAAPTLTQYASDLGTIPYEALTSIAGRVKRVYVRG